MALNIIKSRGSPLSSPSMIVSEWQVARDTSRGPRSKVDGSGTAWANLNKKINLFDHDCSSINNRLISIATLHYL